MDAKVAYEGNDKAHAALRTFKFIDQTDRSREAATTYQAVVRSHVMTEIRRQKRSKVKLTKEAGDHVTALASKRSSTNSCKTWGGTDQLPPSRSGGPSGQDLPSTLNNILEPVSYLAEPFPARLMNSGESDPNRVTSDETRGFEYAFDFQTVQPTIACPLLLPYADLETHTLGPDPLWVENAYSDAVEVDADTTKHVPMHYGSDQTSEALQGCDAVTIISPTILGISRIDPFLALPIPADRDIYQLVDHYTVTIPFVMYGTRSRNPVQHQLYNVAIQDPAAFHAMLAYSARQFDSMGSLLISKRALSHSSRTLRLIHERIREPSFKCEDGLVMAVALLAFAERRFGDDAIAQRHWHALGEIFRSRGGMEGLPINRWLAATLYWNCLVWSGTFDRSTTEIIDWSSLIATNEATTGPFTSAEFTSFFANLTSMKLRLLSHVKSGCSFPCLYSCSRRRSVFAPTGPLYKLVAPTSLSKDFDDSGATAADVQRTNSACQLPCLLYLNIVMIEYQASPELLEHYLGKLIVCIYEESMDMDISAEHLLIRLLIGIEESTAELTSRAHQTIRMASVVQKLGAKSRQRIHSALLEALVLDEIDAEDGLYDRLLISREEILSGSLW